MNSNVLQLGGLKSSHDMYKISQPITIMNHLTEVPCGVCPLIHRCFEGGDISPNNCSYYTKWLELAVEDTAVATAIDMSW